MHAWFVPKISEVEESKVITTLNSSLLGDIKHLAMA